MRKAVIALSLSALLCGETNANLTRSQFVNSSPLIKDDRYKLVNLVLGEKFRDKVFIYTCGEIDYSSGVLDVGKSLISRTDVFQDDEKQGFVLFVDSSLGGLDYCMSVLKDEKAIGADIGKIPRDGGKSIYISSQIDLPPGKYLFHCCVGGYTQIQPFEVRRSKGLDVTSK